MVQCLHIFGSECVYFIFDPFDFDGNITYISFYKTRMQDSFETFRILKQPETFCLYFSSSLFSLITCNVSSKICSTLLKILSAYSFVPSLISLAFFWHWK